MVVATSGVSPVQSSKAPTIDHSLVVDHRKGNRGSLPSRFGRRAPPGSSSTSNEVPRSATSLCLTPGAFGRPLIFGSSSGMPPSWSPRDPHLPRCSWAILDVCGPGPDRPAPSPGATAPYTRQATTGLPSAGGFPLSADLVRLGAQRSPPPGGGHPRGLGLVRRYMPPFKVGVCYARGPSGSARHTVPSSGSAPQQVSQQPLTREEGGRWPARSSGPHAAQAAVSPSSAVAATHGFPAQWPDPLLDRPRGGPSSHQGPPGRRGAALLSQPWSAGSPSNGMRSHARPRARSLQLPAPAWRQAPGRGARRTLPTGSAGALVPHTSPRSRSQSIRPRRRPRMTGEVSAPPE
ncbi:hypothetical protein NDU88_001682 [Pleurodeles waltl]|uniref:Uncharacterized protein n=1 Tax=Pleurodeles waltl TaxID=8319 RepID=A0AAV7UW18_PLEWA|nr:hypothetical protein NDU88_001682 [Pleurodeles waltl]